MSNPPMIASGRCSCCFPSTNRSSITRHRPPTHRHLHMNPSLPQDMFHPPGYTTRRALSAETTKSPETILGHPLNYLPFAQSDESSLGAIASSQIISDATVLHVSDEGAEGLADTAVATVGILMTTFSQDAPTELSLIPPTSRVSSVDDTASSSTRMPLVSTLTGTFTFHLTRPR